MVVIYVHAKSCKLLKLSKEFTECSGGAYTNPVTLLCIFHIFQKNTSFKISNQHKTLTKAFFRFQVLNFIYNLSLPIVSKTSIINIIKWKIRKHK